MKSQKLKKEIKIRRLDVEKFLIAIKEIAAPIDLKKRTRIVVDYNPENPMVNIACWAERQLLGKMQTTENLAIDAQKEIKKAIRHFGIQTTELAETPLVEITNNKNTRRAYGIERIMMGSPERKARIIIDYDTDYPVMLLRIFSDGSHMEELAAQGDFRPNT